ncbi:MAG: MFS transporter, partial [Aggregatilineales bacterium]
SLFGQEVIFAQMPDVVEIGVGLLMATIGLSQVFTQLYLVKHFVVRLGDGYMILIGTVFRSLSMIVLVVNASIPAAVLSMFLFAVGAGMQMPALQSLATTTVGDEMRGGVMGLYQSAFSLAIIFGSAIAGTLFANSPTFPYIVGAVLFAFLVIPAFFLVRWIQQRDAVMLKMQPAPAGD